MADLVLRAAQRIVGVPQASGEAAVGVVSGREIRLQAAGFPQRRRQPRLAFGVVRHARYLRRRLQPDGGSLCRQLTVTAVGATFFWMGNYPVGARSRKAQWSMCGVSWELTQCSSLLEVS